MPRAADPQVEAVRRFNRFYTRQIGVLQQGVLQSPFSLTEARLLYELAHRDSLTATALGAELGLDSGYLSRLLRGLQGRGLIEKRRSKSDGRTRLLALTRQGRRAFGQLDAASRRHVAAMLQPLPAPEQRRLVGSMDAIQAVLGPASESRHAYLLRPPAPGDLGWVVARHGALYAQEWGWDESFEGLVAGIVARFVEHFDPERERCWIAEKDGENVGSVFVVRESASVARLRMLIVEPRARGLGIGARLVDECLRFARGVGYRRMTLWTSQNLGAARGLYERAGFRKVNEDPKRAFGDDVIFETWDLDLRPPAARQSIRARRRR